MLVLHTARGKGCDCKHRVPSARDALRIYSFSSMSVCPQSVGVHLRGGGGGGWRNWRTQGTGIAAMMKGRKKGALRFVDAFRALGLGVCARLQLWTRTAHRTAGGTRARSILLQQEAPSFRGLLPV